MHDQYRLGFLFLLITVFHKKKKMTWDGFRDLLTVTIMWTGLEEVLNISFLTQLIRKRRKLFTFPALSQFHNRDNLNWIFRNIKFHRKRILFQIDTISASETWTQTKLNWSFWIIWSNIESRVASNGDKKQTMKLGKKDKFLECLPSLKLNQKEQ